MEEFDILDNEGEELEVSERLVHLTRKTAPWILVMGVMGLINQFIGLYESYQLGDFQYAPGSTLALGILGIASTVFLIVWGYSLTNFGNEGTVSSLEDTVKKERIYWTSYGVVIIAGILFIGYTMFIVGDGLLSNPGGF